MKNMYTCYSRYKSRAELGSEGLQEFCDLVQDCNRSDSPVSSPVDYLWQQMIFSHLLSVATLESSE